MNLAKQSHEVIVYMNEIQIYTVINNFHLIFILIWNCRVIYLAQNIFYNLKDKYICALKWWM